MRALPLAFLLLTLLSCGPGPSSAPCGPGTCNGCCDATGVCRTGEEGTACGRDGFACQSCPGSCALRVCGGGVIGGPKTDGGVQTDAGVPPKADAGMSDAGVPPKADAGTDAGIPPKDCRTAPCPSGNYCNLGDGKCLPGCASDSQCPTPEICNLASHQCQCQPGFHRCSGACVPDNSPNTCGSACTPCQGTPRGQAACSDAGMCEYACDEGFFRCSTGCCTITTVQAVGDATCVLTSVGGVKCWGDNGAGILGDGTTFSRSEPRDVKGLTSGVTALAQSAKHICALTSGGGVKCWGLNEFGELGDGTVNLSGVPVDPVGLSSGVTAVSVGYNHSCAILTGGALRCWGNNEYGQLGINSSATQVTTPTVVAGVTAASTVGVFNHRCALTTVGGLKCWGTNTYGMLGDNTTTKRLAPVDVLGLTAGVSKVSLANTHSCALTTAGAVKCWGYGGLVGDGTGTFQYSPMAVVGLGAGVTSLQASEAQSTCVLTASGGVKCWGTNTDGALGDGTTTARLSPVDALGLSSGVASLALGEHSCAVTSSGALLCWGANGSGQLGDGSLTKRLQPTAVSGLSSGVAQVSVGYSHTCARLTTGALKCWGWNYDGQVGASMAVSTYRTPVFVTGQ